MASGHEALDAHIARLRTLGTSFVRDAAPEIADACRGVLERQIAAGVDPNGKPWPAKKDGEGKPLAHAADALVVVPVGTTVFMRLKGPEARHHKGIAKGGTVRRILPVVDIPAPMSRAITSVLNERFEVHMGGRK
jgi:hypothetical protein